jgi:hypothetical protein
VFVRFFRLSVMLYGWRGQFGLAQGKIFLLEKIFYWG